MTKHKTCIHFLIIGICAGIIAILFIKDYVKGDIENLINSDKYLLSNETKSGDFIIPPQIDYEKLKKENEDFIAWMSLEACGIDLPIMQGEDNSYYLHHSFDKQSTYQGSLFIDFENAADFSDPNTILYGHNMRNGSMFGGLKKYKDEEFAHENDTFWICTENGCYYYRIFSVQVVNATDEAYILLPNFDEVYADYLKDAIYSSMFAFEKTPDTSARTLMLSTCSGASGTSRRLLIFAYREGVFPEEGCTLEEAMEANLKY